MVVNHANPATVRLAAHAAVACTWRAPRACPQAPHRIVTARGRPPPPPARVALLTTARRALAACNHTDHPRSPHPIDPPTPSGAVAPTTIRAALKLDPPTSCAPSPLPRAPPRGVSAYLPPPPHTRSATHALARPSLPPPSPSRAPACVTQLRLCDRAARRRGAMPRPRIARAHIAIAHACAATPPQRHATAPTPTRGTPRRNNARSVRAPTLSNRAPRLPGARVSSVQVALSTSCALSRCVPAPSPPRSCNASSAARSPRAQSGRYTRI